MYFAKCTYHTQISYTPYDDEAKSIVTLTADETTIYYVLTDLRPGTQYQISVMASTRVGLGAAADLSVMTSSNSKIIYVCCR